MPNNSGIKQTGYFVIDLMLALLYPQLKHSSPAIRYIIETFLEEPQINDLRKRYKANCKKVSVNELTDCARECMIFIQKVYFLHANVTLAPDYPGFDTPEFQECYQIYAPLFYKAIAFLSVSLKELENRMYKANPGLAEGRYFSGPALVSLLYVSRKYNDQIQWFELVKKALNSSESFEDIVGQAIQKELESISKSVKGIDATDEIRLGEFYIDKLQKAMKEIEDSADKKTYDEVMSTAFKQNENTYLFNQVRRKAIEELTDEERIRKVKDRLLKKGIDEEQVTGLIKEQYNLFDMFKNPKFITINNEDDKGQAKGYTLGISEQYIPSGQISQEKKVIYVQTDKEIRKLLLNYKKTVFKSRPAGRAMIDCIIAIMDSDGDDFRLTNREIAKQTGFHEDVISRARKRLEKELPIIRQLLQD